MKQARPNRGRGSGQPGAARVSSGRCRGAPGGAVPGAAALRILPALLAVLAWLAAGCGAPIGVRRVDARTVHRTLTTNALATEKLSPPTRNRLAQRDLVEEFDRRPGYAIVALHEVVAAGRGTQDDVFALAEMCFLHAEESGRRQYYLAAAVYAYAFLFPEAPGVPPQPFDPRLRVAADLYNRGLTSGLESTGGGEVELRSGEYPVPFGTLDVSLDRASLRWSDRELIHFLPVAELEVEGLKNRYRRPGIGAPLAASTVPLDPENGSQDFVPRRIKVPVTAVLRIDEPTRQLATGRVRATLEIYAESNAESTRIGGEDVPLEYEPTAALAATLAEAPIWQLELRAFFSSVVGVQTVPRLAFIAPYRPGRIPVVFVHGTASSAGRWADMFNDLENDAAIRERYQFWFFTYDTGNPIAYSGGILRQSLEEAVTRLDPDGKDPALQEMVVIGHSQGGLLTKLTAVDTGSRLWDNVSREPIEKIDLSDEDRALLRRTMFVKPLPFVRRVVFIATPHRGSYLTLFSITGWVRRMIALPGDVMRVGTSLLTSNQSALAFGVSHRLPTSLDNMTPGNPFIRTVSTTPLAPGVTGHSIIAVEPGEPVETGNDGVVEYQSAHVDGVDSELVVRSGHSCQSNAYAIAEVRRILLLHAGIGPTATAASPAAVDAGALRAGP